MIKFVTDENKAQEEKDQEEFKEWWEKDEWSNPFQTISPYEPCQRAWLASRRVLREKETKNQLILPDGCLPKLDKE